MITNEQKERIRESLEAYVKRYPSQNKAVNSLKGTSAGTVSSILNRKWDLISDDMWMKLAAQLDDDCDANDIVARALGEGLLLNATGPRTLRFLPPLICGKSHVDALIERLGRLL